MINKLSWKIGGEQGEGLESTAEIFSTAINSLGYHMYSTRNFASRIKGGHSSSKICISEEKNNLIDYNTDILIAFDQATLDNYINELTENSIVIVDEKIKPIIPEGMNCLVDIVPITEMAKNIGSPIMKNMITLGICSGLVDVDKELFINMIREKFSSKGEEIVSSNIEAFNAGRDLTIRYMNEHNVGDRFYLKKLNKSGKNNMWILGNHAAAMGSMAAGCRLYAGYPITPATEIMEYLFENLYKVNGAYVQTEDEIAALGVVIGANYAGVRAMTATSGPGISLMTEFLGLAVMSEQPSVLVDVQRGGPATGLPTKIEQSDIFHAVYGGHGDASRIVLAPTTVEDCFYTLQEAFNLAEIYQTPVIVLMDLQLGMNKETVENFDFDRIEINRGKLLSDEEITEDNIIYFKRYGLDSLVSERTIPGQIGGIHNANSSEHSIVGLPSENYNNRSKQTEKRMKKIESAELENPYIYSCENEEKDILLVGINSTYGVLRNTAEILNSEGYKIDSIGLRQIYPVSKKLKILFDKYRKIYVVEHNHNSQLRSVLTTKYNDISKFESILKYNGDIFYTHEVIEAIKKGEK